MNPRFIKTILALSLCLLMPPALDAYPLDGYADTGIRRVEGARLAQQGVIRDMKQVPGALWSTKQVDIRLLGHKDFKLPEPDPVFSAQIKQLLGEHANNYGIVVLDLSDIERPRLAEHRGDFKQNVGSVGKLLVALGIFQALADTWPDDEQQRISVLANTLVTADAISQYDHHSIRLFNPETLELVRHPLRIGDQGSQWEFLDWMLSISSNAAAAMNQRQGMLMVQYGKDFPPTEDEITRYFKETSSRNKTALYQKAFYEPITRNGLDLDQMRQGSFLTRGGKKAVNGGGNSFATANQLLQFLLKMEKGELVDEFSSRQLKRLLYLTERRIRYASSPALRNSAVYFKSGSLYQCRQEEGFECGPYRGNVRNHMNSVAIIETPPGQGGLYYLVVVTSNVLRKNSALEHQALGTSIHQLIQKAHPVEVNDLQQKQ